MLLPVRDERGQSLSLLVVGLLTTLLLVAGLVVDGGAQSAASRRAEQAASEAARAAVDAGATARAAGRAPSGPAMVSAAESVLRDRGVEGRVSLVDGRVRVATTLRTPTVFLGLVGITELQAGGSAEADLRAA